MKAWHRYAITIALALAGRLDFDPVTDTITNADGVEVRLDPPVGEVLPAVNTAPFPYEVSTGAVMT